MRAPRSAVTASVLGLHPDRQLLLLTGVLSALVVQVVIAVVAHVNWLEVALFALVLLIVAVEPGGLGSHLLTAGTALGWIWAGTDGVDTATLVVACALLVSYACLTLVSHGHPRAPVAPALVHRWARQTATVGAFTVLVWCAALLVTRLHVPTADYLSVAGLCGFAAVALWWRSALTSAGPRGD